MQSSFWETNRSSANEEIPRILWDLKVRYGIHKCQLHVSILRQINPVCVSHPGSWRSILILFSHLRLILPVCLLPLEIPTKICIQLFSPTYVLHAPPMSFFSIWSPNNWRVVQILMLLIMQFSPISCYPVRLRPKYSPQIPYSQTPPDYVSPSMWATKFHTHTIQQAKLQFCVSKYLYFWIAKWKKTLGAEFGWRRQINK